MMKESNLDDYNLVNTGSWEDIDTVIRLFLRTDDVINKLGTRTINKNSLWNVSSNTNKNKLIFKKNKKSIRNYFHNLID